MQIDLYELIGFVSGVICVYLVVKQNIWNWPVALVNAFFYILVFYEARLYADMGLQIIYIFISIYGWYEWLYGGKDQGKLSVTRTGWLETGILSIIGIGGTFGLGLFLSRIASFWPELRPADLPYWDALTTVVSLIAQWLMARKKLESWVLWISVDIIYIGMYYYKALYLTMVLYAIFLALAAAGYFAWRKSFLKLKNNELPTYNPYAKVPMHPILISVKSFLFRWTGIFMLFALLFVGWSAFLLLSVNSDQEEMGACVSMINRLNALEKSARDLDNVLTFNPDEADRGIISSQWSITKSKFDTARLQINSRDPLYLLIRQSLTTVDSIVNESDHFFMNRIQSASKESLASETISAKKSISAVIDHIKQGITQVRGRSRELSIGLSDKWTQLNILVVVSCFLAFITAILLSLYYSKLRAHQSDKKKLIAAQNELGVINAQRNTILTNTIEQLSLIVTQLTDVTNQQTQALNEQSVALNQTTTTAQQISVTSQQSTHKAEMVANNAETSMNTTQRSKNSVDTAIDALSEIHRNSQTTMDHFRFLNEKMRLIETISVSVKDIAKKTNILALNAGIEAFKAGDLGKGLTVVANEVRTLAERSQAAASEISDLALEIQNAATITQHSIQEGFSAVEQSVQDINNAGQLMEQSLSALTENDTYAKEILVDHRQQAIGIDQLTQALDSINHVVKQILQNTDNIRGTVEAAEALTASLKQMLDEDTENGTGNNIV